MRPLSFLLSGALLILFARLMFAPTWIVDRVRQPDDSDGPNGRSGMTVLRDYKTGREYLAVAGIWGMIGITPRLGPACEGGEKGRQP